MAEVAGTYPAEWQPRQGQSLAGQTATVIQRDGTRKLIRFGRDVRLRREGARPPGTTSFLQPVIEGHIDCSRGRSNPTISSWCWTTAACSGFRLVIEASFSPLSRWCRGTG